MIEPDGLPKAIIGWLDQQVDINMEELDEEVRESLENAIIEGPILILWSTPFGSWDSHAFFMGFPTEAAALEKARRLLVEDYSGGDIPVALIDVPLHRAYELDFRVFPKGREAEDLGNLVTNIFAGGSA